jgi:hypothetical protein
LKTECQVVGHLPAGNTGQRDVPVVVKRVTPAQATHAVIGIEQRYRETQASQPHSARSACRATTNYHCIKQGHGFF